MNRRKFLIGSAVVPLVAVLPAMATPTKKINYSLYYDAYNRSAEVIGSPIRYIHQKDGLWVRTNHPKFIWSEADKEKLRNHGYARLFDE